MSLRLVAFDLDGTLVDSFPWFRSVINDVAKRYGFRQVDEREGEELRGLGSREIVARLGIQAWKLPLIAAHLRRLKRRDAARIPLFPGAGDMLRALRADGLTLALVTSDSRQGAEAALGAELTPLFAALDCGASLTGKPQRLARILKRTGVAAGEALYIGDEIRDGEAAAQLGMAFGAVAWGYTHPEALARIGPRHSFARFEEITSALTGRAADDHWSLALRSATPSSPGPP